MRGTLCIARDVLQEAASKKWFLALGVAATLLLVLLSLALRIDLAEGAFAAARLFDMEENVDLAAFIFEFYEAAAALLYFGGLAFGILACSDFAPNLLTPGRVEHLLALPLRRWELLLGTTLGVLVLAITFLLYTSGGVVVILGIKSGIWSLRPLAGAAVAAIAFVTVYCAMLTTTLFFRSAAISAAAGFSVVLAGILASQRDAILPHLEPGVATSIFAGVTSLLPKFWSVGTASMSIAGGGALEAALLVSLAKTLLFGAGVFALGVWRFEGTDL